MVPGFTVVASTRSPAVQRNQGCLPPFPSNLACKGPERLTPANANCKPNPDALQAIPPPLLCPGPTLWVLQYFRQVLGNATAAVVEDGVDLQGVTIWLMDDFQV